MNETIEKLYNDYLNDKLDLVFEVKQLSDKRYNESEITVNTDNYGNYYFVNQDTGNVTRLIGYDQVWGFKNGSARVKKHGLYNYVDKNGRVLYETWFHNVREVEGFSSGTIKRTIVKIRDKYNLIDTMGNILCDEWYDDISSFLYDGNPALIRKGGEYNYININGQLLSDKWFDDASMFQNSGFAVVAMGDKYNVIDKDGKYLFDWKKQYISQDINRVSRNYIEVKFGSDKNKGTLICLNKELNGYKVSKLLNIFVCSKDKDKFKIKYEPIKIIDKRFVLCIDDRKIFLYDREINKYNELGSVDNIEYDDNFIYDNRNKKVYFVYDMNMYDITNYYNTSIKGKEIIRVNKDIKRILTRGEFSTLNDEEIRKRYEEDKKENEQIKKTREEKENITKLEQANREQVRKKREIKQEQDNIMDQLSDCLQLLEKLEKEAKNNRKVPVEEIFINVENHREIQPLFIKMGLLKYIDFKGEDFKNVKMSGIDFRGCSININPQLIYNKDLSNCNLEGITISPFTNFRGVDIRGTKFGQEKIPGIKDEKNVTFQYAIYDDETTYNGISFVELYGECKTNNTMRRR